jgi:hypothetical protein
MKHTQFQTALIELRKWNEELERLQNQSEEIPADERIGIDTKSEDLRQKLRSTTLMLQKLDNSHETVSEKIGEKVGAALSELREGFEDFSEMIGRLKGKKD